MESNQKSRNADLIVGDEFEKALSDAAEVKRESLTSLKERNRDNYSRFYEVMLMSRKDIQEILDRRSRDRTDSDKEAVKAFKRETSQVYRQVCQLLAPEELEDGEQTRAQKLVAKVAPLVRILQYIGCMDVEKEFEKYGISLEYEKYGEDEESVFRNEGVKSTVMDVFENGKSLKAETERNAEAIKTTIFETAVPPELQFDKSTNPTGIRSSDFCRLVDLRAKILMAQSEEAKEKAEEKASDMAGQCEFDMERSRVVQSKLVDMQSQLS